MTAVRAVAVVVPAHDEQDLVLDCLDAIAVARVRLAAVSPHVVVSVVVALDACRDDTAVRIAGRPGVDRVDVDARCVGTARAVGTVHALAGLGSPLEQIWTAHTDADSCVPPGWLVAMVDAADGGSDVVVGTVVPDAQLSPPVRAAWTALHLPGEDHAFVHGANLGVRASTLVAVGGWRPLVTGEDVDLVTRLRATPGVAVRSTATMPVVTSSRADARAPAGFSSFLRDLTVA